MTQDKISMIQSKIDYAEAKLTEACIKSAPEEYWQGYIDGLSAMKKRLDELKEDV